MGVASPFRVADSWPVGSQVVSGNLWLQTVEANPGHSAWYIDRFRKMAEAGNDLDGEARMIDAMVGRQSRILDAGCGPGRVGGRLAALGHTVVGVDIDPALIAAAVDEHPEPTWIVADLAEFDLTSPELVGRVPVVEFDAIVSAGNVMTFLDPTTRQQVLARMAAHLAPDGRAVVGFGAGRGYSFDDFFSDAAEAGLTPDLNLATWDLRPLTPSSDFLVAILKR